MRLMTSRRCASPIRAVDPRSHHSPLLFLRLGLALAAPTLGGCMSVYITDAEGEVRVSRGVGLLRVEVSGPKRAVIGSVEGIGLLSDPLGWSAGYTRQRWALLGDDCRSVVWPGPGGLDERTREALARAASLCVMAEDASLAATSHSLLKKEGTP